MTFSPITSLQTEEEKVEVVIDFIFFGSKIIAGIDLRQKVRRCLVLRRKAMTNIDSVLKSRDLTLPKRSR